MHPSRRSLARLFALPVACGPAVVLAQDRPTPTPVVAELLRPPRPVPGSDGRIHLLYELRLANVAPATARLRNLQVLDGDTGRTLLSLDEAALADRFSLSGMRGGATAALGGHQWGVAFLHLPMPAGVGAPGRLLHALEVEFDSPGPPGSVLRLAPAATLAAPIPVLGPPLAGEGFLAGDGCCNSVRHIRALLPLNGTLRLAQRFAIDWERIGPDRRIYAGERRDPRSYRIYANPVFAVADGVVVAAGDGLPDQVPGEYPRDLPIEDADGNHVVLDIGGGAFVLYAHLRRDTVAVQRGERVRRGQRIGAVGNSGNTVAPHLHLHVMDGPSPLLADGMPHVFDAGLVTAEVEGGTAAFDKAEAEGTALALRPRNPPLPLRGVLPLDLSIVDWGG
jgi:hypothetical protein